MSDASISREARELYAKSDVIDLHLDSFIWTRIFGYDLRKAHGQGVFGDRFYSHTDFPRCLEAGLTGATWIITTNPARPSRNRRDTFFRNLARLEGLFASEHERFAIVKTAAEYDAARAVGKHGAFLGIQGGNALDFDLDDLRLLRQRILRITLVHLTKSKLGASSAPFGRGPSRRDGLTDLGRDYVRVCNQEKIFVDLAHISRQAFFDAVAVHDKSQPLMVTHTGIAGVYEHWRNVTDEQIKAVAGTGGTVGVMFQADFLGRRDVSVETIVDHLEHLVAVAGEDTPSIGTDYDGAIVPPKDMPNPMSMPKLVDAMLRRGFSTDLVQKILGGNALRTIRTLRG